nr:PREDICTED: EF-hand calcium-binding domain-containing protein 12 [Anolis carolinensis]|eukprot:XP_008115204.1 PREDICTED: EF-hand calcium-binding domain-containing protein 12 [Anolis carolinensis]
MLSSSADIARKRRSYQGGSRVSQAQPGSLSTTQREKRPNSVVVHCSSPDLRESSIMDTNDLCKQSPLPNPDKILGHCFKQFKLREAYPHFFFKVKKSRFGPPRSRRRIFIAPPMGRKAPFKPTLQPHMPFDLTRKAQTLEFPLENDISSEEDEIQKLDAWIEKRKQLWDLLNCCVNLEEWLNAKQPGTELEASVLGRIKEDKEPKEVKMEPALEAVKSIEHLMPKRPKKKAIPLITMPYPEALKTLQNLLHKQKQKLVDIFNKADRSNTMKFRRADIIKIIQATNVPISQRDLEDIAIYLTSLQKGNCVSGDELAECQRIWMESLRDQWKRTKETKPDTRGPCVSKVSSCAQSKSKFLLRQMDYLEVPPINTEPDRMHLTYSQMEVVGKRYKEMRRMLKRKIDPLDFAEQCRMVKTGDRAVDGHCLPSTMEGEVGELVDKHRLACHLVWTQCVKRCRKLRIPISEKALKKGLLYPGDRILREENQFRKMRQPGGYYSAYFLPESSSSDEESRSTSPVKRGKPKLTDEKEDLKEEKHLKYRWLSYAEFRKLMRNRSKRILPPVNFWKHRTIYENILETPEMVEEEYIERELMKMFNFLNPLTDPNSFWPGHLLDKLYFPEMEHDGGHPLFHRVSRKLPVYPSIYSPDRNWPVNDQGYVTYGDPDSRKHNYYI